MKLFNRVNEKKKIFYRLHPGPYQDWLVCSLLVHVVKVFGWGQCHTNYTMFKIVLQNIDNEPII